MRTINISDESYEKIKDQLIEDERLDIKSFEEMIGKSFYFRTVTYHCVGKIVRFIGNLAVLSDASWVADSGRFMGAIKEGTLSEVEPVGDMMVSLSALVDLFPWKHKLPKEQI